MRYAVAYMDPKYSVALEIRIIEAENWRNALQDAFGMAQHLPTGDDLKSAKKRAYLNDWEFDVVEISDNKGS